MWDRHLLKWGTLLTWCGPLWTCQFNCYSVGGHPETEFCNRPINSFISASDGACTEPYSLFGSSRVAGWGCNDFCFSLYIPVLFFCDKKGWADDGMDSLILATYPAVVWEFPNDAWVCCEFLPADWGEPPFSFVQECVTCLLISSTNGIHIHTRW